ncbi:MAG: putative selenium-dependent hydroxylase accessory protein YqeC [Desulfohalobiaceae bacterium]|nr:putative selenium-dependent hydroxylase accessory protein YqeC [Desulfohalobiaceae bacterium]
MHAWDNTDPLLDGLTAANTLIPVDSGIICLVGAGGKTSLMFRLAKERVEQGQRVLTTTTTKIVYPEPGQSPWTVVTENPLAWLAKHHCQEQSRHLTLARARLPHNKLQGFAVETIEALGASRRFDWILVEADGAAGRPLKAPAAHEPVIPEATRCVIAVLGLQGFGRALTEEWCFRPHIFAALSGLDRDETMDQGCILRVLTHAQGILKGTPSTASRSLFLNQADDGRLQERARQFLRRLDTEHPGFFNRTAFGTLQKNVIIKI